MYEGAHFDVQCLRVCVHSAVTRDSEGIQMDLNFHSSFFSFQGEVWQMQKIQGWG